MNKPKGKQEYHVGEGFVVASPKRPVITGVIRIESRYPRSGDLFRVTYPNTMTLSAINRARVERQVGQII